MLRAVGRFLRRAVADPSQLALPFDGTPRDADELLARLRALGLRRIERCRLTRNRSTMVSFRAGELRVHEGFLGAGEPVLRAIVAFVEGRTRAERAAAQQAILAHPVERRAAPARRPTRTRPEDEALAARLTEWHRRYNAEHFGGVLTPIDVRVSRRMRSRLGHYTAATPAGDPPEIAIGRSHIRRHGWAEALHTLLHEMVHQWQDETGRPIDHGRAFRAKAREVGVTPSARRVVGAGDGAR